MRQSSDFSFSPGKAQGEWNWDSLTQPVQTWLSSMASKRLWWLECSLGLQQLDLFTKLGQGARTPPHSPSPPPTLKMFCTCSSLKSVPGLVSTEVLSLLCFPFTPYFCPTLFSVSLVINASHSGSHTDPITSLRNTVSMGSPLKRWLSSMWWVLQSPEMGWCPPCFPDHCPFIFCKMNKWDQTDDPSASLKHTQIITNAPITPSPPALFWAVQSLHPCDSVSPQWYTDRCPQGLAPWVRVIKHLPCCPSVPSPPVKSFFLHFCLPSPWPFTCTYYYQLHSLQNL